MKISVTVNFLIDSSLVLINLTSRVFFKVL